MVFFLWLKPLYDTKIDSSFITGPSSERHGRKSPLTVTREHVYIYTRRDHGHGSRSRRLDTEARLLAAVRERSPRSSR